MLAVLPDEALIENQTIEAGETGCRAVEEIGVRAYGKTDHTGNAKGGAQAPVAEAQG